MIDGMGWDGMAPTPNAHFVSSNFNSLVISAMLSHPNTYPFSNIRSDASVPSIRFPTELLLLYHLSAIQRNYCYCGNNREIKGR